ncbi:MAG: cell division protein FtsQ/DivIB [Lachnospiraceae bacterium]|nr:cell division protein FtsQ/DivIB [Lachnospiraceae bacterium]
MIKEKRRQQRKRKRALIISLAIVLVIFIAFMIVWNVFTVKNVVVEGNELYSTKQIEEIALNDEYSWNSLYVLFKSKFIKSEEVPFVDVMEISLDDPHTVHIKVYEKGSIGYIYLAGTNQNAYFDKDGFVIETSEEEIEGVPRVDGLGCDKVVLYEKLPIENESILKEVLVCTQALKKYEVVPETITFDSSGNITLRYETIKVLLGDDTNLTEKIMRLPVILPDLEGKTGTLHVEDWTTDNKNIIFREESID